MNADVLIVTDIYPARERPIQGISGEIIVDAAPKFGHKNVRYVADKHDIPAALTELVQPGDLLITMGAGDIYQYGAKYIETLEARD